MAIKSKIETLVTEFKKERDADRKQMKTLEDNREHYTPEYYDESIEPKIREIRLAGNDRVRKFNEDLNNVVQTELSDVEHSSLTKNTDFQLGLSNALSFITLMGDKLRADGADKSVYELVQPFFGDYGTMKRLSDILSDYPNLSATISTLSGYERQIAKLNDFAGRFKGAFNQVDDLSFGVALEYIYRDADSYDAYEIALKQRFSATYNEVKGMTA
jgi:hypothetical protein